MPPARRRRRVVGAALRHPGDEGRAGSGAVAADGIIPRALAAIRRATPDLLLITDVCLCEYTDHGHCGVLRDGEVDNDPTLELLAAEALAHARAGADIVAPSDMMDGRVGAIRRALDAAGFTHLPILSYAAKFASGFYGPFRDAARVDAAVRRPPRLPDGSRERRGGAPRGRARRRGRRRHGHGEAGAAVPRRRSGA